VHDLIVCGAGISGLSLAHFARRRRMADVVVLEAAPRAGGKVQTEWLDGNCCEWGPQGFLDNVPETLELARQLGLAADLVRADAGSADRFIARAGRLRRVPLSPPAFLLSDVLSLPGRLRVLLEPFQPGGRGDESVLEFATRRIGREAAEVLVDAMVTGVYAGDPAQLSLPATFPRMRAMEEEHGSLTKAMLARGRNGSGAGPAGPGGTLTTLFGGMQQLTDALAAELGPALRTGVAVRAVRRRAGAFEVALASGEVLAAPRVVSAVPPRAAAQILADVLGDEAVAALRAIPAVGVVVVMTGYASAAPFRRPTRGFGFLVPGRERRPVLGTIYCDATFPHEAPPGRTLLRTLLGGARDQSALFASDDDLVATVRRELDRYLGGDVEPDFVRVVRHEYGIPQYTVGHPARLAAIRCAAEAVPGLEVIGNGLHGIAANACIATAAATAERLRP
jgi:protoporphyrinogen/coproporphyrinogen III oxidase